MLYAYTPVDCRDISVAAAVSVPTACLLDGVVREDHRVPFLVHTVTGDVP